MTGYQITANDLSGFKRHNTGARAKARYEAYQREAASKKLTPADKLARISALNRTEPICNLTKKHKLAEKNSGKKSFFGEKFIKVEYVKGNFPAASVLMTLMFACVLAVIVYSSVQYAAAKNVAVSAVFGLIMGTVTASGIPEAIVAAILVTVIGKALLHFMAQMKRR